MCILYIRPAFHAKPGRYTTFNGFNKILLLAKFCSNKPKLHHHLPKSKDIRIDIAKTWNRFFAICVRVPYIHMLVSPLNKNHHQCRSNEYNRWFSMYCQIRVTDSGRPWHWSHYSAYCQQRNEATNLFLSTLRCWQLINNEFKAISWTNILILTKCGL